MVRSCSFYKRLVRSRINYYGSSHVLEILIRAIIIIWRRGYTHVFAKNNNDSRLICWFLRTMKVPNTNHRSGAHNCHGRRGEPLNTKHLKIWLRVAAEPEKPKEFVIATFCFLHARNLRILVVCSFSLPSSESERRTSYLLEHFFVVG